MSDALERAMTDVRVGSRIMPATDSQIAELEANDLKWRVALFGSYLRDTAGRYIPDAPHHRHYWTWLWAIERGQRPKPFVGVWPRGGAKSTNAELGVAAVGSRGRRRYAWYVSATQDAADNHVATISSMLESPRLATFYPDMSRRRVGKYGSSKGWRRERLRTASNFTIDAVGLDTFGRGVKIEEDRPDFLIFDDIDDKYDAPNTVEKKIGIITNTLIPAGSEDRALLFIQNLIHPGSVFAKIVDGSAGFITNRILSGPVPAIEDLTYQAKRGRVTITGGTPTWVGYDLERAQSEIDEIGISAFLEEAQHEVEAPAGGMFDHLDMASLRIQAEDVPALTRVVCWVDPAVTKSDQSDAHAIQIDGIDGDARTGTIYRLYSWEQRATPLEALTKAIRVSARLGASYVGVETDQGGDTWRSVFREAREIALKESRAADETDTVLKRIETMRFAEAKAGQGDQPKAERAGRMLVDYELPGLRIRHVLGTHNALERALRRFPKTKPLDLVDAGYWSWNDLRNAPEIAASDPERDRDARGEAPAKARGVFAERDLEDPYAAERGGSLWS